MKTMVWYCDTCNGEITDPHRAIVIWKWVDRRRYIAKFEIVHKGACDTDYAASSMELAEMLGTDGMQYLLALLSAGAFHMRRERTPIRDFVEFTDIFRRLHTPGYEEARRHFWDGRVREELGDLNEVAPYTERYLQAIVRIANDG